MTIELTRAGRQGKSRRLGPSRSRGVATAVAERTLRERALIIALAAGVAAGVLLSANAWIGNRLYPATPVLPSLGSLPRTLDIVLYVALLAAVAGAAMAARPARWIATVIALGAVFVCFDQSRLQPWFYQYLVMLGAFAVYGRRTDARDDLTAMNVCRLVIVCIYLWSGLQKVNAPFIERAVPWLIAPITRFLTPYLASAVNSLAFMVPLAEILIGCGLLTRRFRAHAVIAALGMHAALLFCLGPLGWNYNSVVWPWNVVMASCVVILFWNTTAPSARQIVWPTGRPYHALVLGLLGFAPALSFVNLWDQYLSFALYVRPRNQLTLYVVTDLAYRLPDDISRFVYPTETGLYGIDVTSWSRTELNLPVYPEPRVYKAVGRFVCSFAQRSSDVRMVIRQRDVLFSTDREIAYGCPASDR